MNFTKLMTGVALSATVLLTGCALTPKDLTDMDYYDVNSRAWNIASLFGPFPDNMDKRLPGKMSVDEYLGSFFTTNTIDFYSTFTSDFGMSKGSAMGLDVGLNLLGSFGPKPVHQTNVTFGYLPANKAADATEARKVFNEQFMEAFEKMAKKAYPNAKTRHYSVLLPKIPFFEEALAGAVQIEDESMGCKFLDLDTKDWSGLCEISFYTRMPEGPVMSAKRLGPSVPAYYFLNQEVFLRGDKNKVDWVKILMQNVDDLPEMAYVYLTQQENFEEREYPPMVLEKGKVNLFVKPQRK